MALLKSLWLDFWRVQFCRLFNQTNQSGSFAIGHSPGCIAIKLRTVVAGVRRDALPRKSPRDNDCTIKDDGSSLLSIAKRHSRRERRLPNLRGGNSASDALATTTYSAGSSRGYSCATSGLVADTGSAVSPSFLKCNCRTRRASVCETVTR
jgi:hypothetical protein